MSRKHFTYVACALTALTQVSTARADPAPSGKPGVILPPAFCFRITDIEPVPGDMTGEAFIIEFEVLNWTSTDAACLNVAANVGCDGPSLTAAGVDPDGRGGPLGGADIGPGVFDSPAVHSGRGRGDIPGFLNDWSVTASSATSATWAAGGGGTPIPFRGLLGMGACTTTDAATLVPGTTVVMGLPVSSNDSTGDPAVDGGPGVAPNPVVPDGSGNVLDGFTLSVENWSINEVLSLNWFLTDAMGAPIGRPNGLGPPFGASGNAFGFGVVNLVRIPVGGSPPSGLFVGNTGFLQGPFFFFDTVFQDPSPAEFAVEFGASVTAAFKSPNDNIFGVAPNTTMASCPWDLNGDGFVLSIDLAILLGSWNPPSPGAASLAQLLGSWGACP